jgi:hypothetical protein
MHMQSITFAVPTLATAQMTRQDQIDILANQAAAAIVCCYLEHMNTAINKGISGATLATESTAPGSSTSAAPSAHAVGFITQAELVTLINNVQNALRTVP